MGTFFSYPYAVMTPKVTLREKKICETAVDHASPFKVEISHSPMYASMPFPLPSREHPAIRKTKRRTIGNPIVIKVIVPVVFKPKAMQKKIIV